MTVITCGKTSARPYLTSNNGIVAKTQPNALRTSASVAVVKKWGSSPTVREGVY
jgi:hypothetical protein